MLFEVFISFWVPEECFRGLLGCRLCTDLPLESFLLFLNDFLRPQFLHLFIFCFELAQFFLHLD